MKKIFFISLAICLMLVIYKCGSSGSTSSDDFFFTSVKQVTPVISGAVSSSSVHVSSPTDWDWGNVMFEIYESLRDYVPVTNDPGGSGETIGLDNMYKVLYQTGEFYTEAKTACTTITEKRINSPFDFGNTTDTYNCAVNDTTNRHGSAIKEDATTGTKYVLLSWEVNNNNDELGVIQGSYNPTSGDVNIDIATYVHYTSQPDFCLRSHIEGNEKTHLFTLKMIKYTADTGGYTISLAGHGISQGTGNHFLFNVLDNNGISGFFCFNADATATDLDAKKNDPASSAAPADCSSYSDAVTALTLFTTADVPKATTDFNAGTTHAGDIYLDIN